MKLSPTCPACDRLAIDYVQTVAEDADFVAEHEAAVQSHDYGKIWDLKYAVRGSEMYCGMAQERLDAHRASHGEYPVKASALKQIQLP